jgi:hypothetical protein
MLGSSCRGVEFLNMRPGKYVGGEKKKAKDLAFLREQGDPWDDPIYDAATKRFWRDVRKYKLRPSTCHEICPQAPDFKHAKPGPHDEFPKSSKR